MYQTLTRGHFWKFIKSLAFSLFLFTLAMVVREYWSLRSDETQLTLQLPRLSRNFFRNNKEIVESNRDKSEKCLQPKFKDVLFIAAFGAMSEFESLPLFEVMYKKVFRHRVYCGPDYLNKQTSFEDANFAKVNTRYGAFLYDCLTHILQTHRNYSGYIFVSDGVILNPRKLSMLDQNHIWESNRTMSGPDLYGQIENTSEWWTSPWGMQAIEKLYEYFTEVSYYNNRKTKTTEGRWISDWDVSQILNRWLWNGKGKFTTYWSHQTFLYLPAKYSQLYLNITKHVRPSGVRHDIALPTVTRMLELEAKILKLPTGLVNKDNENILDERVLVNEMIERSSLIYLDGKRKERRRLMNHLTIKEYGVGEFLKYNSC